MPAAEIAHLARHDGRTALADRLDRLAESS